MATALCARLARKPYVVMVFDLWEENAYSPESVTRARRRERRLLQGAARVIVYCEAMAEHYAGKHGLSCEVIATPIDPGPEPGPRHAAAPGESRELLLAGAVYWAQEEAVRRVLGAAAAVDGLRTTMLGDESALRERGFTPDRFEPEVGGEDFRRRIAAADLLFLGLSLSSPHPDVVRTATPARLADYMASGRPILVHAPPGAHVSRYARTEAFAEVMDQPDEGLLAEALREMLADPRRAEMHAARARALARERHDVKRVAAGVARLLDELQPPSTASNTDRVSARKRSAVKWRSTR
jgi:glycosyltransferase involved in cell wall biosynthesis